MTDLPLSVLSRGCGRFVFSSRNAGRHDGRLDVCFTPQDYYIWKSRESLLQLSNRGHVLAETESILPKTYSTRRGPLLLYSQYFISLETSCHSETRDRKKQVIRRYTRQVDRHLRNAKELSSTILSNRNNQFTSSRLDPLFFPPPHFPLYPDLHCLNPVPLHSMQAQYCPRLSVQLTTHHRENNAKLLKNQLEDNKKQSRGKRVRLDLFLQIPRTIATQSLEIKPQPWLQNVGWHPAEEAQIYLDASLQHNQSSQHAEINHHSMTEETPNMISVHDPADEHSCFIHGSETEHRRTGLIPLLKMGYSVHHASCRDKTNRPKSEGSSVKECRLPPIADYQTVGWAQTHKDTQRNAERVGLQRQQNLSLPLLFPVEKEPSPPVGPLGCAAGRKGPGKQSSFASFQTRSDTEDTCETSNANRGIIRGILPLELRDLQDGKSVGSLILGPDGEITQLSLFNSNDLSEDDGDTQEKALQVLSAEGDKLPWVIVLQPEHADTEDGVKQNTNVLEHPTDHKLLDLHRQRDTRSTSSHTDLALSKKKAKSTNAVAKNKKKPKMDTTNSVDVHPLRKQMEKEGPKEGYAEAEEEKEEEELGSHISDSHQLRQKIHPGEDQEEDATEVEVNVKREKRKDAEEASITQEKIDKKMESRAQSNVQKMPRMRKGGRRQTRGSDTQMTNERQKQRTNKEASQTLDQSAFPSVKKMTEGEGERGENLKNEVEEEQGENLRWTEESVEKRKKRKRNLKHKELAIGRDVTEEEPNINQKMEEDSHIEPTEHPSATQRHSNEIKPDPKEGIENLSFSADSKVQSLSSLGSADTTPLFNYTGLRRSTASSCEEVLPTSRAGPASSHGCLSSCSTVMVMEEQLMLNPVRPESSLTRRSQEGQDVLLPQKADRQKQEAERKKWEREQTEERLRSELEEERRKRAMELRLKRLAEEEETKNREEEEQERARREQAQRERERRKNEERRQMLERLQRMREEEKQRKKAALKRFHLEEERRQEEECQKLQEMDESERIEYLQKKEQEEEDRRSKEEECKRAAEEADLQEAEKARIQAELLARQMALLQQQLAFRRGLILEARGLGETQSISRPWIYSYFTLLQLMGLNSTKPETITP